MGIQTTARQSFCLLAKVSSSKVGGELGESVLQNNAWLSPLIIEEI